MCDEITIRSYLYGSVFVVARRGAAFSLVRIDSGGSVRSAIAEAISGLPHDPPQTPIRVNRWLAAVAARKLPPTSLRAAMVIATRPDKEWIGIRALGEQIGTDFRVASKGLRTLVRAGFLERSANGTRAIYRRVLP